MPAQKKPARKKNPAAAAVKPGKLNTWIAAKKIRVRRINGKTLVDVKR